MYLQFSVKKIRPEAKFRIQQRCPPTQKCQKTKKAFLYMKNFREIHSSKKYQKPKNTHNRNEFWRKNLGHQIKDKFFLTILSTLVILHFLPAIFSEKNVAPCRLNAFYYFFSCCCSKHINNISNYSFEIGDRWILSAQSYRQLALGRFVSVEQKFLFYKFLSISQIQNKIVYIN